MTKQTARTILLMLGSCLLTSAWWAGFMFFEASNGDSLIPACVLTGATLLIAIAWLIEKS